MCKACVDTCYVASYACSPASINGSIRPPASAPAKEIRALHHSRPSLPSPRSALATKVFRQAFRCGGILVPTGGALALKTSIPRFSHNFLTLTLMDLAMNENGTNSTMPSELDTPLFWPGQASVINSWILFLTIWFVTSVQRCTALNEFSDRCLPTHLARWSFL